MTASLAPIPFLRFTNTSTGLALIGGQVFTYAAGTTTPQATYTDSTGTVANTNPIILNARGECTCYLNASQSYKLVVKDALGNTISTYDNLTVASHDIVTVEDYGAVGDATATTGTDDSAAFQRAIDAVYAVGGGRVRAFGRYRIGSNITVRQGVILEGCWLTAPGELTGGGNYDGFKSVLFIASTATINLLDSSGASGFVAIRFGLDLPFADATAATAGIAAFAGTAFTVGGQDVSLRMFLILGFNIAVLSNNWERVRCEYVSGDCLNGILIANSADVTYVNKCHFWPFTTAHQPWATNALLRRAGEAYAFSGVNDWARVTDCFSYGYFRGFHATDCSSFTFIGCSADNTASAGVGDFPGSEGFRIEGTNVDTRLIGCNTSAQSRGFDINTVAGDRTQVLGCTAVSCSDSGLYVSGGDVRFIGGSLWSSPFGITIGNTVSRVFIDQVSFKSCTTKPINFFVANSTTFLGSLNDFEDGSPGLTVTQTPSNWTTQPVASAATLILPVTGSDFTVTGTTNIGALNGAWTGREVTFYFTGILTIASSNAGTYGVIRLSSNANMTTAAGSVLKLRHNGVQWFEVGRSA